jgi:hypothetical protein
MCYALAAEHMTDNVSVPWYLCRVCGVWPQDRVDALKEQEWTSSRSGCHDVRGARLMTLDRRLNLVVVGIVAIIVGGNDGEYAPRAQVDDKARTPHGI